MDIEETIAALADEIAAVTRQLERGVTSVNGWQRSMMDLLRRYAEALFPASAGGITPAIREAVESYLRIQGDFLDSFASELAARGYQGARDLARAVLYANSLYQPASLADVITQAGRVLPLPALPGEGSQCGGNCRCRWEIEALEGGDYDAYWRLEPGAKHCQTCIERALLWDPLQIRDGMVL